MVSVAADAAFDTAAQPTYETNRQQFTDWAKSKSFSRG